MCSWKEEQGVKSLAIDIEHWRHIGHEQWMAENQLNLLGRPWWEGYSTQDLLHDEHNQVPIFASWGVLLYYPSPMHYDLWELVCDMANSTHLYLPENFLVQILGWLNKNSRFKKACLVGISTQLHGWLSSMDQTGLLLFNFFFAIQIKKKGTTQIMSIWLL